MFFWVSCSKKHSVISINDYKTVSLSVIDSLIHLSEINYKNDTIADAFDNNLKGAAEIAKKSNNQKSLFDIYIIVAQRLRNSSKYSRSVESLQKAMTIAEQINSDSLKAKATHEMAVNFRRINDNAQALKYHIKALELAENAQDTFLIHCSYNGIGNVYFEYKDYKKAIDYFHKSLQYLGKEHVNLLGDAINSNLLGESWLYLGNTDSALYYLKHSFDVNVKIGSKLGQAICYNGIGLVYYEKKEYKKAIKIHKKALNIYKSINDKFYQTMCLNNMGKTYLAMKKYALAEKYLTKTYNMATEIGSKRFALDASIELSRLYNIINKSNLSYKFSRKALAYKDSITKELQEQNTQAISILYKTEKQKREIIILKQKAQLSELKLSRQQNAMIAFIFIIMFLIMFGVWFIHQRKLKSKLKEIDLEQKLLQARLNPHFIFNSLAAIQNFILQNDKKAASEYIVNFSRLMRNILMGTGTNFILLQNELEILDDYLKLQQLRFQNKFDYFFEISDDIDPETCVVPPMLVQPFVENSIEHGVRDIEIQGIILIKFIKDREYLIIEVEDNGRGLSDQQETEKKKGHISMATKITNQRMQNIKAITKKQCNFEVLDVSSLRNTSGVLVRIRIPYNEE